MYPNETKSVSKDMYLMLEDFYIYSEYLLENNSDLIIEENGENYLMLSDLNEDERMGLQIIAEVIGDLGIIKNSGEPPVLKDFVISSSDYSLSPEIQIKYEELKIINRTLISQSAK